MKFIAYYDSPLGKITLAGDGAGLCGLWFEGEKYYAHALATSGADDKFYARDIAAKTDAAAREGCYEKSCALKTKSGADKKRIASNLFAKEQHTVSETQRDFAALKKSEKSDFAAKATDGADEKYNARDFAEVTSSTDGKFYARTLIASGKFFTRDFAAYDAGKNLTRPTFRRKARVKNST